MNWFSEMGFYGYPLVLLALVVFVLIVLRAVQMLGSGAGSHPNFRTGLNAILFWGAIAAVMGFLGQYHGMYHGLRAIAAADALSPFVIARGLAESFTTTLFGLVTFLVSALAWFTLGALHRRAARSEAE